MPGSQIEPSFNNPTYKVESFGAKLRSRGMYTAVQFSSAIPAAAR
jgi:hypothetical protein